MKLSSRKLQLSDYPEDDKSRFLHNIAECQNVSVIVKVTADRIPSVV